MGNKEREVSVFLFINCFNNKSMNNIVLESRPHEEIEPAIVRPLLPIEGQS